jgi:hypothetical protein
MTIVNGRKAGEVPAVRLPLSIDLPEAPGAPAASETVKAVLDDQFLDQMVAKGERRLGGLSDVIISLYAGGMTTRDIAAHRAGGRHCSRDRPVRRGFCGSPRSGSRRPGAAPVGGSPLSCWAGRASGAGASGTA